MMVIFWRRPQTGAQLNLEVNNELQDRFNSLAYKSCANTNDLYKYISSIPIQLHDVNSVDKELNYLRLELYNFVNVFREGGFSNYLEWRAPKELGWQPRQDSFKNIRRVLESVYGTNQAFATLSDSIEPYVHLESKGTMYRRFIDGVCIDSSLESLRNAWVNDWSPGRSTNALLGVHVFNIKKDHPLLVPRGDVADSRAIISINPNYTTNSWHLLENAILTSLSHPVFLFETPNTLEAEIAERGSAVTAYIYFLIMSSLEDGRSGRPVIAQLHWVTEKKRWIWDYLTWGIPPPPIPPPINYSSTNFVNSVF